MSTSRKHLSVALSALVVVGLGASLAVHRGYGLSPVSSAVAAGVAPATEVDVALVVSRQISQWQSYSGRLEAVDRVDVRPLVSGTIVAVYFKDGALVKKGDPLFSIDPRPYQAEVDRAAGQLAAAESRAGYTATDASRAARLIEANAVSKRDFDEKQNASREAVAQVKTARAALEVARINLGYTTITAPVSGRVSRAELTVGNSVSAGASAPLLTTLMSVSPIYASFDVDEQTYLNNLSTANGKIAVTLGLANENGYSREGLVDSLDNHLDSGSGTIRVRARFDNPQGTLLPGLYARIKVGGDRPHAAILVDDSAIGTDQAKKYVLVVDGEDRVHYREVTLGDLHEGLRVVTNGLQAGERIIVNGIQRARPNDSVRANSIDMADVSAVAKPAA
ncbi:efflux RND transporter periplasmic adaptor subunit [Pseudomonas sp. XS1P51]